MQMSFRTSITLCFAVISIANAVSPTQKVIQLLGDMEANAKSAKKSEAVEFGKFSQFCKDKLASTTNDVKKGAETMDSLNGDISKLTSDISELGEKIGAHNQEVESADKKLTKAKDQRKKDKDSYEEQIQDLSESVDGLERAMSVMKKQDFDRKQPASALLQLTDPESSPLPESIQRTVSAFMQMSEEEDSSADPNAYEFQSGGILELLQKLHGEFKSKKTEAEKENMNSQSAFEMMSQDLHDTIENNKADIEKKTTIKQQKTQTNAEKKKNLKVTTTSHDDDEKYLASLTSECAQKTDSFNEKQELRADEIIAVGKAIEIMTSDDVSGNAEEHLPSAFVQGDAGSSFAQLRSKQEVDLLAPETRLKAAQFFQDAGRRLHSQRLGMIAERISVISDPFTKVKKMIDDMITKLLEETGQESEQKGFCDKELGTNKKTRTNLQSTIDALTAKIDDNAAIVASTTQRIGELAKEVLDLQESMREASGLRIEEKDKNKMTVKDAKDALKAIEAATAVLKDFYTKASAATGFLQEEASRPTMGSQEWIALANPNFEGEVDKGHKEGQQTFGKTYKGQQAQAGGVFAMLEVISSDFSALVADTTSSEATAVKVFKDFMRDSQKSVAVKEKESELLKQDRDTATSDKTSDTKDLKRTQDMLLAAGRYYDKLKPTCVDTGISYKDRVAARESEIESLQEGLRILQGF